MTNGANSLRIRVADALSLCQRCTFGMVMERTASARGGAANRTATFCESIHGFVPSDIETCSRYAPIGQKPFMLWGEVPRLALPVDPREDPGQVL